MSRLRWSADKFNHPCSPPLKSKTDQIRDIWAGGDQIGALRIAARFFDRSDDTFTFKRGMSAQGLLPAARPRPEAK